MSQPKSTPKPSNRRTAPLARALRNDRYFARRLTRLIDSAKVSATARSDSWGNEQRQAYILAYLEQAAKTR